MKEIKDNCPKNCHILLFGNKNDLDSSKRAVPKSSAKKYARENNIIFMEGSAKDDS